MQRAANYPKAEDACTSREIMKPAARRASFPCKLRSSLSLESLEERSLFTVTLPGEDEVVTTMAELEAAAVQTTAVTATPASHAKHVKHLKHVEHLDHLDHREHLRSVKHDEHIEHVNLVRHRNHVRHMAHEAHVLRTTFPAPIHLTALERNDWATIREEVMENRPRI